MTLPSDPIRQMPGDLLAGLGDLTQAGLPSVLSVGVMVVVFVLGISLVKALR